MTSVEIATGYVTIEATARGLNRQITAMMRGVDQQTGRAGEQAGRSFGDGLGSGAEKSGATSRLGRLFRGSDGSARKAGRKAGAEFADGIDQESRRATKSIGGLGSMLAGGAVFGGAAVAIGAVATGIKSLASEAVSASDATDKFRNTLAFANIDTGTIDKLTKSTKAYADATVYDLADIQNTTAQLAANGVKGYAELAEAAGNLNAVAGGNAETFKSVGTVMTQTAGAGKLTTENWNQLADAIPGASGKLQEAMLKNGAYTGNFRKAMEKGEISAEEFNKAISQLGMTDVAKEAATSTKTIEGAWGNLQASLVGGMADTVTLLKPTITDFLGLLAKGAGPAFAALNGGISAALGAVNRFKEGAGQTSGVVTQMRGVFGGLSSWFTSSFAPAISGVFSQLRTSWATAATIASQLAAGMMARLRPLMPQVKQVFSQIGQTVVQAMDLVKLVVQRVTQVVAVMWRMWGKTLMDSTASTFRTLLGILRGALNIIQGVFKVFSGLLSGNWREMWAGVKQITSGAMQVLKSLISQGLNVIKTAFSLAGTAVKSVWSAGMQAVRTKTNEIMDAVKTKVSDVTGKLSGMFSRAVTGISGAWGKLQDTAKRPVEYVVNTVINRGLVDNFNKIGKPFGVTLPSVAFASGGIMPGYSPGKDNFHFIDPRRGIKLALSGGEGILRPEITRMLGPRGIDMLNSAAKRGKGAMRAALDAMGHYAFAQGGIVNFRGHRFSSLFASRLALAERMAGRQMQITQGGFRPQTSYSGTSHRGDALDIAGAGHQFFIPFLRSVGIPSWDRTGKGNWISHTHGVPLPGAGFAAGSAVWQAQDYLRGGDGLGGRDNGPRGGLSSKIAAGLSAIGDKLVSSINGIGIDFTSVLDPVRNLMSKISDNPMGQLAKGIAQKAIDMVKEKGSSLLGFSRGGSVRGPGTGTSDSILARLSNGEFVMKKWAVDKIGSARLNFMNRFGELPAFAAGGVVGSVSKAVGASDRTDWSVLAGAMNALAQAVTQNTAAQRAAAKPTAALKKAQAGYTSAVDAKKALAERQKLEDIAYQQAILNAKRKSPSNLLSALSLEQKTASAKLRAEADYWKNQYSKAAAKKDKSGMAKAKAEIAANANRTKKMNEGFGVRRAVATQAKAGGAAAVTKLTQKKQQNDLNQQKAMAKATAKVTAAQKALTAAQANAKPVTDKASAANALLKQRQEQLAETHQQLVDSIKQASSQMQDGYAWGFNLNDWIVNMQAGRKELLTFQSQIGKLRSMGLDEPLIDIIEGKGVKDGGAMASQIIAGGTRQITRLEQAASGLKLAADKLAVSQENTADKSFDARLLAAQRPIMINGNVGYDPQEIVTRIRREDAKAQVVTGLSYAF